MTRSDTTKRHALAATLLLAAALGVSAGCGGGGGTGGDSGGAIGGDSGGGTTGEPVVEDVGLSITDVTDLTLEGELSVSGWVVEANGKTFLCTSASGSPPTCGKPSLVLVGYDGTVPSAQKVTIVGEVTGATITASG